MIVGYHAARLEIPEYCPPHFEELMLDCWEEDPTARPTFKEIVQRLDKIAASGARGGGKGRSPQIGSRGGGGGGPSSQPRKQHKRNRKSWDAEARDVFKEAGLDEHKKQQQHHHHSHDHDDQQREDKGKDKHQDLKERTEEEEV